MIERERPPQPFPCGRWRARWIWCAEPQLDMKFSGPLPAPVLDRDAHHQFGAFRCRFNLGSVPAQVPARMSADSRYILWVNGAELSRGPIRAHSSRLHFDMVDLASVLQPGPNVVAVLACFYAEPTPWWGPARPLAQLGAGCLIFEARLGEAHWVVSGADWRCRPVDGWELLPRRGIGATNVELYDARQLDGRWREVDFDDSAWRPAVELAASQIGFQGHHAPPSQVYGALLARPIPQLTRDRRVATIIGKAAGPGGGDARHPVDQVASDLESAVHEALPSAGDGGVELPDPRGRVHLLRFDFGQVVAGTVLLDVDAPPGARFDVSVSEFADPLREPGGADMRGGFRYTARGAADRFETFDPIGFRYATVAVRADGPVRVRPLAVCERLYPRPPGPFFECSDATLNRIWAVGRRTVDLTSHDAYLDCPTREQRAWTGDFVVHQMVDLASNPDWGLARHQVVLAASPRADGMLPMAAAGDIEHQDVAYIPDWALHWVHALHNLYRYTGDRELVQRLLPVAENVLRWFVPYQATDGLLTDVNGWVLIDWSSVVIDGRSAALNALWGRALLDFAEMSEWVGDLGRNRWARSIWERLRGGFEFFWDAGRAVYVDNILAGERGRTMSQHVQAAALCGRLVPPDRVARLIEVLLDKSRQVHATWSVPSGDARYPKTGEGGIGGVYLLGGPPAPWWDVENQVVVAQPFFRYVVHDALALAGRADLIAEQCLDWQALLERCATSLSETWYGGTTCHGWSATPTRDLLTRTLGIAPAEPGFAVARIAPRLGFLTWARGAVPTPRGLLSVSVTRESVAIVSPVPFDLDLDGCAPSRHPPGRLELPIPRR